MPAVPAAVVGEVAGAPAPAAPPGGPAAWHGRCAAGSGAEWDPPRCVAASGRDARPGYDAYTASEYIDTRRTLARKVAAAAALLRQSTATVAYTGAGVSTAAGVPDYASKAPGSRAAHMRDSVPMRAKGRGSRLDAQPTASHHVLAALEERGHVHHWLQQNHDRLAQKAGFPQARLNEIHGAWGDDRNPVKMMDEELRGDLAEWMRAWEGRAELCLALGTSLCGMNADRVAAACAARHAEGRGQGLVVVGLQRTQMDPHATVRIWGLLEEVLPLLARELRVAAPLRAAQRRGGEWAARHPGCRYRTPKRSAKDPL